MSRGDVFTATSFAAGGRAPTAFVEWPCRRIFPPARSVSSMSPALRDVGDG